MEELENAIEKITMNNQIDMIILKRIKDKTGQNPWSHTITSGQRILKTKDLEKVFETNVSKYQLEIAINMYMIRNKKKVFWMPFSIHNQHKWVKWGYIEGMRKMLEMTYGFISYAGIYNFIWQTLFFCKQEAP